VDEEELFTGCGLISGYTATPAGFDAKKILTECMEQADTAGDFLGRWGIPISGYTATPVAVYSV